MTKSQAKKLVTAIADCGYLPVRVEVEGRDRLGVHAPHGSTLGIALHLGTRVDASLLDDLRDLTEVGSDDPHPLLYFPRVDYPRGVRVEYPLTFAVD